MSICVYIFFCDYDCVYIYYFMYICYLCTCIYTSIYIYMDMDMVICIERKTYIHTYIHIERQSPTGRMNLFFIRTFRNWLSAGFVIPALWLINTLNRINPSGSLLHTFNWYLPAGNIICSQKSISSAMLRLQCGCVCCLASVGRPLALYWFLWALMLNKCGQVQAHVPSSGVVFEWAERRGQEFVVREGRAAGPTVCVSRILPWESSPGHPRLVCAVVREWSECWNISVAFAVNDCPLKYPRACDAELNSVACRRFFCSLV